MAAQFTARDVERARDELLADAGLAGDEHGRVRRRDAEHAVEQLAHRGRAADDVLEAVALAELLREHRHLAEEAPLLERLRDAEEDLVLLERLRQEVVRPAADRLDGGRDGPVRGHHDDLRVRRDLLGVLQDLHPVDRRHAQVGEDHVEGLVLQALDRRRAVLRLLDRVPRLPEDDRGRRPHVLLVVDDEDLPAGRVGLVGELSVIGRRVHGRRDLNHSPPRFQPRPPRRAAA
jgi:hypothetical protein